MPGLPVFTLTTGSRFWQMPAQTALQSPSGTNVVVDLTYRNASTQDLERRVAEGDQEALAELVRRGGEVPALGAA